MLSGKIDATPYVVVRDFWQRQFDGKTGTFGPLAKADGTAFGSFDDFWRQIVHDGYLAGSAFAPVPAAMTANAIGIAPVAPAADALD